MVKCLVLGGGGFLGSHLSEALIAAGYSVRILEKGGFSRKNLQHIIGSVEVIEGDWEDSRSIEDALEDVEVVFHLVSTTLPANSNEDPAYDIASNVLPTLRLLDVARRHALRKVVFFSSGGTVYGITQRIPIDEDHPTNPICSYGIQKLVIEKYLALYAHLYGLQCIVLRISNAYGERQSPTTGQGVIAAFIHKALRDETISIWGDGSVVRDYIHVSDIAQAAICCLEYQVKHRVFNIGSGIGRSLCEVLHTIEECLGHPLQVEYSPARPLDVPVNVLDISRARQELHWSPGIAFRVGVEKTLSYFKELDK
jgi:UDP-glucose 4-epimerase